VADRQALHIRRAHTGPVWSLAFRPEGRELLSGGADGLIHRWSVPDAAPLDTMAEPSHAAAEGATLFRRCVACHTLEPDGGNRAGPTLHALFGRRAGSLPGYTYSRALAQSGIIWTEDTVARLFEQGPDSFTPGSKMPLQRLPDPAERAALIAFLKTATAPTGTGDKGAKP
jgi:cytochrome c